MTGVEDLQTQTALVHVLALGRARFDLTAVHGTIEHELQARSLPPLPPLGEKHPHGGADQRGYAEHKQNLRDFVHRPTPDDLSAPVDATRRPAHPSLVGMELPRRDPLREAFDLAGKALVEGPRGGIRSPGPPRPSDPAVRPGAAMIAPLMIAPLPAREACIDPVLAARCTGWSRMNLCRRKIRTAPEFGEARLAT